MNVLGISALYHDAAACLVKDGEIIAAAQEERFTRIKHDLSMPINAVEYCLKEGKLGKDGIDIVVFYDNPLYTLDRFLKNTAVVDGDARELVDRSFEPMFEKRLWVHKLVDQMLGKMR